MWCWPLLTSSTTCDERRKHQLFLRSHSILVIGLLHMSLVLLRIEIEKGTTESPRSKAKVHHWKPTPVVSIGTLANVHLMVEDLWTNCLFQDAEQQEHSFKFGKSRVGHIGGSLCILLG